ncbi:hypothetical protein C2845_PM15G10970 [Panicum miliaceum]|uniref:Uncharacterized protein n=1 Tax=Panicum miliaceum TaxID=4540 RepID=A0A3L6Q4X5_PANMI|nr:hypothetical protein C2845_PM15G10970 [Panicum miliaceum]
MREVSAAGGHDAINGHDDDGLVVDYTGDPVDKSSTGGWLAGALIAGVGPAGGEHGGARDAGGRQMALLYVALYTIAVGAGGLKANRDAPAAAVTAITRAVELTDQPQEDAVRVAVAVNMIDV